MQIFNNVPRFLDAARRHCAAHHTDMKNLALPMKKMTSAFTKYEMFASEFHECASLDNENQASKLVCCLAATYPEHVAVLRNGIYYAGGLRVRGAILKSFTLDPNASQIFILSGSVDKFKKPADGLQHNLRARAAIILPTSLHNYATQRTRYPFISMETHSIYGSM